MGNPLDETAIKPRSTKTASKVFNST